MHYARALFVLRGGGGEQGGWERQGGDPDRGTVGPFRRRSMGDGDGGGVSSPSPSKVNGCHAEPTTQGIHRKRKAVVLRVGALELT
jgi:hypothetical protein